MKYKAIKSAAHNFGDSFASGLNYAADDYIMSHLARRALTSGRTEMIVDLLTGEAAPIVPAPAPLPAIGEPGSTTNEAFGAWLPTATVSGTVTLLPS